MSKYRLLAVVCSAGILAACAVAGCGKKEQAVKGNAPSAGQEQTAQSSEKKNGAVCIYDGIALKQEPTKNGKWLASISLGEMVQSLGDSAIDTSDKNRTYQKIRLSDGKNGWAISWGLALNAKLAAVKQTSVVYKRPDLLTGTDVKIQFLSPIAITQEKDDWAEFTGEGRKISGWLTRSAFTADPNDVAVAVLASKKLASAKDRIAVIKEIIASSPYPESFFIKKLQEEVDAAPAPAADTTAKPADSAVKTN